MTKVFIITSGCYSDYGIDKVFLDRDKAEDYLYQLSDKGEVDFDGYGSRIEEYEVTEDDSSRPPEMKLRECWVIDMPVDRTDLRSIRPCKREVFAPLNVRSLPPEPQYIDNSYVKYISLVSKEHVIKLAAEGIQARLRAKVIELETEVEDD